MTCPSGTVIPLFYAGGVTLREVQVTHPLAVVEAVEDSRVAEADRQRHGGWRVWGNEAGA